MKENLSLVIVKGLNGALDILTFLLLNENRD